MTFDIKKLDQYRQNNRLEVKAKMVGNMKFGNESETLEFKKSTAEIKEACASISPCLINMA